MFLGQFVHNVDEKGRLTIPARFRDLLDGTAYITSGFEKNLLVLTEPRFNKMKERLNELSLTDLDARQLKRLLFSNAAQLEFDKAGRILLPAYLREAIGVHTEAILVGVGDYFEIWSPENWKEQENILQDTQANATRFASLDL